ncbi:MAG: hypothetical protein M1308_04755, partial [Actinobacteria bacterium]|nr:hypothetical protein [Actinomycetota bacterium]
FLQSKESPVAGFIAGLLQGQTAIGQPFNVPTEIINRFIPMVTQDMYDIAKERNSPLAGILMGLPGAFGVGSQTYGSQIPSLETTPTGKPTIKLNPVGGLAEDIIAKIRGTPPSNIPREQWEGLVQAKNQETQNAVAEDKLKQQIQQGKVSQKEVVQNTYNIGGIPIQGYELNGKFLYTDPDTGNITSKSIKTIKQQELSREKELTDARVSLDSDQLKRANNYPAWAELAQGYIDYLKEYKSKLTDEADKLKIQNTIEDKEVELAKYKGYGGFKKPKKISVPKITIKRLKVPMPKTATIKALKILSPPKIKGIKSKKTKTIKVSAIKSAKIKGLTNSRELV